MMVKNFFILQLGVKMKKSKRYIKKQNNKPLIEDVTEELEDKAYEEMRHN